MAIATVVFVFVYATILDIYCWINVWKEAKVRVAAQKILEQKRAELFNAVIYPVQTQGATTSHPNSYISTL
jgi:hypothetical protein